MFHLQTNISHRVCVYGLFAIVLTLMFRMLDSWTLDETGMLYILSHSAKEAFVQYTSYLPMLSLYEVLMWLWIKIAGLREFWTRVPSLFFFFGTLVVVGKIGDELTVSTASDDKGIKLASAVFSCLALAANTQVQHFATTARPYALAIFISALSLLFFVRWRRSGQACALAISGAWLGLAVLFKVFAILQFATLFPLVCLADFKRPDFTLRRLARNLLFFSLAPLLMLSAQLPLIIHFQSRAKFHQPAFPPTFTHFKGLVLDPVFPEQVFLLAIVSFGLGWFVLRKTERKIPMSVFMTLAYVACSPLILVGLASVISGSFLVSEKYVFVAYVPAALLAGFMMSTLFHVRYVSSGLAVILTILGVMSAKTLGADTEDWRRAFQVARLFELSPSGRSQFLLFSSGFFESQHQEFEGSGFVQAPAVIYGPPGGIVPVPDYRRSDMIKWVESNLLTEEIRSEKRDMLFIAKTPSQRNALLIAEMLDRRITGIEVDQTQIWLLFKSDM
jgi:hypothetical protein